MWPSVSGNQGLQAHTQGSHSNQTNKSSRQQSTQVSFLPTFIEIREDRGVPCESQVLANGKAYISRDVMLDQQ